jgi:hypothetical protein
VIPSTVPESLCVVFVICFHNRQISDESFDAPLRRNMTFRGVSSESQNVYFDPIRNT